VISNITVKELGATKTLKKRKKLAKLVTRDGRTFLEEIKPHSLKNLEEGKAAYAALQKVSHPVSSKLKKARQKIYDDYVEDSTMRELHQIREELARQQQESGLSVLEWLEATEPDLRKSLAEDGFHMVTRNDKIFIEEIKPQKTKNKSKQSTLKTVKHKNYDDYITGSTMPELQLIHEVRTSSDKIEPKKETR
jgi:hypothetical protein